ncbi:MAG: tripartite tricarboxylate transporter TctB family protein [Clostridiales bacterium]|nr:tripartite tricarboxylate transporter TctB family protein [Clostridiales bacterium]
MKKFGSKQLIPIVTAIIGIVFAYIGFTQLGFWDKEPKPGFFPSIIAIVMVIASIAAFFQTLKEEGQPEYNKNELSVILGGLSIILGSFLVGMIPMLFLFVLFWLKVVEKGTPWKHIIIIEAIIAVIVLGVFAGWLQVQFPWGLFEMFM